MGLGMLMTKMFTVGNLSTNCYVAFCKETREAVVIDPGLASQSEVEEVFSFIKGNDLKLKFIVNTHGHFPRAYLHS
jgi:glyoxylase-like metal-dependent hydrolase (beta-lactamase superfamily II)